MQQEGLLSGEEEHKEKSINLLTYTEKNDCVEG